ncbi:hypothetical protein IKF03_00090 [Candidatus Saccharibacteria bacterium]|nr:hypothetical protein [Candidatus Saccharibacteria bacterium]
MVKKGDTLIEVTLAIGIFSMVAIAIVAVMTGGTSNAQTALETTLAREEIDTQAEVLRFIHASYLADEGTGLNKNPYTKLWEKIVANAYTPNGSANDTAFQQYHPGSCREVFDPTSGNLKTKLANYAFVINPRALKGLTTANTDTAYISYRSNASKFQSTLTYPRLVYKDSVLRGQDSLVEEDVGTVVNKVEGIYVLAVKDPGTTNVVGAGTRSSVYYDFYIRTCWYGASSDAPSTISTVIRLYNPKGVAK